MHSIPSRPDILLVGNVTVDIVDGTHTVGGAVSYAAAVLEGFGKRACVVTTAAADADLSIFQNHNIRIVPSKQTLTFAHTYTWWGHKRVLHVVKRPDVTLELHHIPILWRFAKTILIMPLLPSDVNSPQFLKWSQYQKRILPQQIALAAQGYQRDTTPDGKVFAYASPHRLLMDSLGDGVSIFLSDVESDPWSADELREVVESSDRVLVTRGEKGALELTKPNNTLHIPIIKVDKVADTNGAGDTFATAYMLALMDGKSNPGLEAAKAAARIITKPQSCKPWCIATDSSTEKQESCDQQNRKLRGWNWWYSILKIIEFNTPVSSFLFEKTTDA
eukprot:g9256.t2